MTMKIHPTALVSPHAEIAEDVEIGPYTIIGPEVRIGAHTIIGSHVVLEGLTEIGPDCHIFQFASIGTVPQDLKYKGEETKVIIGKNNVIREYATIHRATAADIGMTFIGNNNLIMAYCHVAHNCKLGNNIIMSNASNLAGHIHIEDHAIIGGMSGVHQFSRIGKHAMIGGASAVRQDVPPFVIVAGNHAKLYGLNVIGMRRRGFSEETIQAIKKAYRIIFRSRLRLSNALEKAAKEIGNIPEVIDLISFIENSERGVCR